jgi:hypothetical protein
MCLNRESRVNISFAMCRGGERCVGEHRRSMRNKWREFTRVVVIERLCMGMIDGEREESVCDGGAGKG